MNRRQTLAAIGFGMAIVAALEAADPPQRVISLVPAVTEMIFAMGAGSRLVGVSSYDRFPGEAARLPRVGGLLDPNIERILILQPDLVILYGTQVELKERLERVGISYYPYEHRTLADITATVRMVGARIGEAGRAGHLASDIEKAIDTIRIRVAPLPHPRTALVFGREASSLRNLQASGGYGFLHDALEAAGGLDAFADVKQQMVEATTEMILSRQPDVIIELRAGDKRPADIARELEPWHALPAIPAVRSQRVYMLVGDEFLVPGPRVVDAIRQLARTLHPGFN
jgi:iron complex transport system substrate-binding protein